MASNFEGYQIDMKSSLPRESRDATWIAVQGEGHSAPKEADPASEATRRDQALGPGCLGTAVAVAGYSQRVLYAGLCGALRHAAAVNRPDPPRSPIGFGRMAAGACWRLPRAKVGPSGLGRKACRVGCVGGASPRGPAADGGRWLPEPCQGAADGLWKRWTRPLALRPRVSTRLSPPRVGRLLGDLTTLFRGELLSPGRTALQPAESAEYGSGVLDDDLSLPLKHERQVAHQL